MDPSSKQAPKQGSNTLAILALVFSFIFAPAGLILGIIALTKKQSKGLAISGIVISSLGLLIFISIINAGSKAVNNLSTNSSSSSKSSGDKNAPAGKIGEAVRDGKFEFTVMSQECGIASVGNQYSNKTAQGQYCKINLKVKNIGDKPQSLYSGSQKLFSSDNKEFSTDDTAMIYDNSNEQGVWLNNINPGNEVTGNLIFDIPNGVTPSSLKLFDSSFSGGVIVKLN
jgi:hypothetical protein